MAEFTVTVTEKAVFRVRVVTDDIMDAHNAGIEKFKTSLGLTAGDNVTGGIKVVSVEYTVEAEEADDGEAT